MPKRAKHEKERLQRRHNTAFDALAQAVAETNKSAFRPNAMLILENFFQKYARDGESGYARFAGTLAKEIDEGQGMSRVKAFDIITRLLVVAGAGQHDKSDTSLLTDEDLENEVHLLMGEMVNGSPKRTRRARPDEPELAGAGEAGGEATAATPGS